MIKEYKMTKDILLYKFGKPFDTGAVIYDKKELLGDTKNIPNFFVEKENGNIILSFKMKNEDRVYGLGQTLGSLDKRGKEYILFNTDEPEHMPHKKSLYGSHPFVFLQGKSNFGFFIDFPSKIVFDIGFKDKDTMKITICGENINFYLFKKKKSLDIIKDYLKLVGSPYVPPKWAFGYQQSRWSYKNQEELVEIYNNFKKKDIPVDAIYLDIDYMKDYKVFTYDKEKFPDFDKILEGHKKDGIHMIPIIDPGVKIEIGYQLYEEGKKNGYFCKNIHGEDFEAAVWPGLCNFPDFMQKKVRTWWGDLYKEFIEMGIEGIWNDMNEPAIFYTKKSLEKAYSKIENIKGNENPGIDAFDIKYAGIGIANRDEDYKDLQHKVGKKLISNFDIHNLYGHNMAKASAEGLKKHLGNKRYFLLTRSSYVGTHREAAIWMGDNFSWWEHILTNIRMLLSLNMAGFFYTGADIGGFGHDASPELLIRWTQLGIFSPFFRNHSAKGTRHQEPWAFDKNTCDIIRDMIEFRYALMPYIYSEYMKSVKNNIPFIRPLFMEFPKDEIAQNIEDQFMFGESIMVAPIHTQNARGRHVYLPGDDWLMWKVKQYKKRNFVEMTQGSHFINIEKDEVLIFIRKGYMILLEEPGRYIDEIEEKNVTVIVYIDKKAEYIYYEDDGKTYDYKKGLCKELKIKVEDTNDENYNIQLVDKDKNDYEFKIENIEFEIY